MEGDGAVDALPDETLDGPQKDMGALFDLILRHVPPPAQLSRKDEPFQMLATTLGADPFLGRLLTGRVEAGTARAGDTLKALSREGDRIETSDLDIEVPAAPMMQPGRLSDASRAVEAELIRSALKETGGHRVRAAERLGISERTLRYRLAEMRSIAA